MILSEEIARWANKLNLPMGGDDILNGFFEIAKDLENSFDKLVAENTNLYKKLGKESGALSRRDQFAMAALSGLLINPVNLCVETAAREAVNSADALIAELDKEVE